MAVGWRSICLACVGADARVVRRQPLCADMVANHTTLFDGATTPSELHAMAPMTRRIDLSSGAQVGTSVSVAVSVAAAAATRR